MGTFKTFLFFVLNALKLVSLFTVTTLLMTLAVIFMGVSVWGATINVTPNAPDVLNGNDCSCSLREAIININDGMTTYADCAPIGSYGNDDTIIIPSGTYTISTTSYNIANNVSIIGAGAGITIIDGNWLDRVFVVGNYSVFISDITITRGGKFQNNGGGGGAIYNSGTLTITNSTVSDSAFHGDNTCGGGIYNNGTLTITNSTITENWASGWWGCGGGGIFNNTDSILVVTNSTISNNKADGYYNTGGGGILNYGTLTVSSSTISGNTETANPSSDGGGILNYGTATFSNTIVANQLIGADCTGSITSNGFNLESSTSCGFTNTGDMQNTDPLLGPLQYNGGQTLTMALLYGSPAIDAGSCEQITDQRGIARPQGKTFDIGAYEYAVCTPPSGMVAWWKADGNANDSVGTNHGTLNNGATIAPGMVKQAFRLDGINDYISTPDSSIFDFGINDFTIDSWINTATPSSTMRLIAAGSWEDGVYNLWAFGYGSHYLWGSGNRLNFAIYDGEGHPYTDLNSNEINLSANTWHHIAVVRSGANLMFYFDGNYAGTANIGSINLGGGSTGAIIGARYEENPTQIIEFANGLIDEVKIYNRALTSDEIATIFNVGSADRCGSCATIPSNLVSWWKAEDNGNDSAGTNHGTLNNGATFSSGKVGEAFRFDGVNDYVSTPDSAILDFGTGEFTIDAWINTPTPSSTMRLIAAGSRADGAYNQWAFGYGYNVGWGSGNRLNFAIFLGGSQYLDFNSDEIILSPNTWVHIAVVRSGTEMKFYLNGNHVGTSNIGSISINGGSTGAIIGARYDANPTNIIEFANGLIDEVEIFNRALSSEEIAGIYNAGSLGRCSYIFNLTVIKSGSGSGTVTSNPAGIICGSDCSKTYPFNTNVTLTAIPEAGSTFTGWSGDCSGTNPTTQVTIDSNKSCTAIFNPAPKVIPDGSGTTSPMLATKTNSDGSQIQINWDNQCSPLNVNIIYGDIDSIASYSVTGSKCGISNPDTWDIGSTTNIWFVLVSDNLNGTESSWGLNSQGQQRNGENASGQCGNNLRDNSGTCP